MNAFNDIEIKIGKNYLHTAGKCAQLSFSTH